MRGGVVFPSLMFNSLEKPIMKKFSSNLSNGKKWKFVDSGMNLRGISINSMCAAFNKYVYCMKGFGVFNINKESNVSVCPMCSKIVSKCNNIVFWNCEYRVDGQVKGEDKPKKYSRRVAGKDELETFENTDDDQREWLFLEITVKK